MSAPNGRGPTDPRLGPGGSGARRPALLGALVPALIALFALAPSADALTQRPFKEVFGSAAQPNLNSEGVHIERRTGDVLLDVVAGSSGHEMSIYRFHADGTPAPFAKLGTNVIDGKAANGKECGEEPASCDATPHGELIQTERANIAIDESGGIADGDIYVAEENWVDIFAADGSYLGELTGYQEEHFGGRNPARAIAVSPTGEVVIDGEEFGIFLDGFVPTSNPVTDTDGVFQTEVTFASEQKEEYGSFSALAFGAGPNAGLLFALGVRSVDAHGEDSVLQFDATSGSFQRLFAVGQVGVRRGGEIAVEPQTGALLFPASEKVLYEYEAAPNSEPRRIGRVRIGEEEDGISGFALNAQGEPFLGEVSNSGSRVGVYGSPTTVPIVTIGPASGVTGTRAILSGTINPSGVPLTGCFFEYEPRGGGSPIKAPCEGPLPPTDSNPHAVEAEIKGLEPDTDGGFRSGEYNFRLVATVANGREESPTETLTTAHVVVTEPAAPISTTGATLNGLVRPEGKKYTACYFEYGLTTSAEFERRVPCTPRADELPQGYSPQPVTAPITGLQSTTTYRYRLVATTSEPTPPEPATQEGDELTFTTQGVPRITEVRALDASQDAATLEGNVNPSGFGTSYRIEWGPTAAYGNTVPAEFEPFLGTGETPVRVSAKITGLSAGSTYHYRIVASSGQGTVASSDHVLETLNSCGLPEGRCYELVSRAEAGPVAKAGRIYSNAEIGYQVDPNGGAITYPVEFGYPDTRKGNEVTYRAVRGPGGWQSTELSPPFLAPSEKTSGDSTGGNIEWISDDLSCGFLQSSQPLTSDASARQLIENGGENFYRLNPDGSFTIVTPQAPENIGTPIGEGEYVFIGASQDCRKVFFKTRFRYPGVPVADRNPPPYIVDPYLYEWSDGNLREVTGSSFSNDKTNVVSADGSRVFFSGGTMIENGVPREYAASQTATPASEVDYRWANRDGSRVFFTAGAGLTTEASGEGAPEGIDLYEYDTETGTLTDRTVVHAPGGARVTGFVAATEDGSVVYFGSKAQLLPGRGRTLKQNQQAETDSIYEESGGKFMFVGTGAGANLLLENEFSNSQISPDGRFLLFESGQNVTGYEGDANEAYLFDREGGREGTTICVSCRQDGYPSIAGGQWRVLPVNGGTANDYHHPQFLVVHDGRPEVFFASLDELTSNAVAGQANVYEWIHDQVFRLGGAPAGATIGGGNDAIFGGASADGTDAYLATTESLNREDRDERISVFDARIGGGFPEAPAPPAPCVPDAENSCQRPPQAASGNSGAATTGDSGEQNFNPKQKQKKKKRCVKKGKKCVAKKHGKGSKGRNKKSARRTGNHGGAGK